MVHDPDDRRVGGRLGGIERERRFAAADEEHVLADAGADRIDGDERTVPAGLPSGDSGWSTSNVSPLRLLSLIVATMSPITRRELQAGRPVESRQSLTSIVSTMPTIAASTGQSFSPDAIRAELPLTIRTVSPIPGVNGVHRHEITAFGLPSGVHRPRDEQLVADQPLVLSRRDHGPDDLCKDHFAFAVAFPIGSASSRFACGRGMTWTETSSPTRRAAAAPASVAALTAATSPRTIAVT